MRNWKQLGLKGLNDGGASLLFNLRAENAPVPEMLLLFYSLGNIDDAQE
jgi:hypothetical protein